MSAEHENGSFTGHVFQINTSNGGVPKRAQIQGEVTAAGLVGDRQEDTQSHGGRERALCLYALEHILALQLEGHPVFPGAMGENLTVAGMGWSQFQPGMRVRIGDQVLIEITRYTTPCSNMIPFFRGGDYSRVSQKRNPGWSRVYAKVLQEGQIQIGDRVAITGRVKEGEASGGWC